MIKTNHHWLLASSSALLILSGCSPQNIIKDQAEPIRPNTQASSTAPQSKIAESNLISTSKYPVLNCQDALISLTLAQEFPASCAINTPQFVSFLEQNNTNNQIKTVKPRVIDSWEYIVSLFAFPNVDNARIDQEIKNYLAYPSYIQKIQTRATPYLYNIIKEIEKKGLPGEFALLPAIESGFKPHAYSRSKAAGLWQFIPATGLIYDLKQNWWYDGRRDVYSSTDAATSYLQKLGKTFKHDWLLALASYNAGMGTVGRSVKYNKQQHLPTDFWSIKLPKETQVYVPRLLALAKIFANPEHYGVTLKKQVHKPTFAVVKTGSQLNLAKAAKLSGISLKQLKTLNPGFNRSHTSPFGPHRLLIPVERVTLFKENLAQLPFDQRIEWYSHKVKSGESISSIAHDYQTNIQIIREINHLSSNRIYSGDYLMVPNNNRHVTYNEILETQPHIIASAH